MAAFLLTPACGSGDDFSAKGTGGSNSGGSAGDAASTGGAGSGGTAGAAGSAGGAGAGGAGSGGTAGAAGSAGSAGAGGAAGSGGSGGNPSGKADGQPCADKTECKSGYCVDDVCCESDCAGDCRTCKASGKEGLCTAYTAGTDPEGDCVGAGKPTDPCAGTCDGKSACKYPDGSKSCGAQVCTSSVQSTFACSGAGACKKADVSCGKYACSGASCLSTCSEDNQCAVSAFCNQPTCFDKAELGGKCFKDTGCKSGICSYGACCTTKCLSSAFSCATGTCKCNGQTCDAGQDCVMWYADTDKDGYGDPQNSTYACANKPPAGYLANQTDCDDGDANAHPGQTQYFGTPRKGKGGYDYNCDGSQSKKHAAVNVAACSACASTAGSGKYPPCIKGAFGCSCTMGFCSAIATQGFASDVDCGASAQLATCKQNETCELGPPPTYCTVVCDSTASVSYGASTLQTCL